MMLDYRLVIPARSSVERILNSQAGIAYDGEFGTSITQVVYIERLAIPAC